MIVFSRDVQGSSTLGESGGVLAYDRIDFFLGGISEVNFLWRNPEKSCFSLIFTKLSFNLVNLSEISLKHEIFQKIP